MKQRFVFSFSLFSLLEGLKIWVCVLLSGLFVSMAIRTKRAYFGYQWQIFNAPIVNRDA